MAGMIEYARTKGRSRSPLDASHSAQARPESIWPSGVAERRNSKRHREAAIARVSTAPLQAGDRSHQHNLAGEEADTAALRRPRQGDSHLPAGSAFGTNSDHADETSTNVEVVEDSQPTNRWAPPRRANGDQGFDSDEFEDDLEESIDEKGPTGESFIALDAHNLALNFGIGHTAQQGSEHGSIFGGRDSYPPTTAGDIEEDSLSRKSSQVRRDSDKIGRISKSQGHLQTTQLEDGLTNQHHISLPLPQHNNIRGGPASSMVAHGEPSSTSIAVRTGGRTVVARAQQPTKTILHPTPQQMNAAVQRSHHDLHSGVKSQIVPSDKPLRPTSAGTVRPSDKEHVGNSPANMTGPEYDYEPNELVQIPYDDLQRETFDHDPRPELLELPETLRNASLDEKLEHVNGLDTKGKQAFLASLTLNEWEEAGDWFMNQFSSLLGDFRDARRKRRRLAADFEDQVHARHKQVATKKRKIDAALAAMKQSGSEVINRTPRKRQK